ncbi:hypothetical protein [uncultured Cellulomonas sp.]|uniref:hypothetical protein n=1 Tax=uncultured Cellulomonas sp. TaxID=189682 RepID=UPI00260D4586|nr:hypothetical protein [uncultured Cellulomonas sp.]
MSTMQDVHRGMRVLDALGRDVGVVERVQPGDGGPVTTLGHGGLPRELARALGAARHVHPQTAARMLRHGYAEIGPPDARPGRAYVGVDQIAEVGGDVVRLTVSSEEVLRG